MRVVFAREIDSAVKGVWFADFLSRVEILLGFFLMWERWGREGKGRAERGELRRGGLR